MVSWVKSGQGAPSPRESPVSSATRTMSPPSVAETSSADGPLRADDHTPRSGGSIPGRRPQDEDRLRQHRQHSQKQQPELAELPEPARAHTPRGQPERPGRPEQRDASGSLRKLSDYRHRLASEMSARVSGQPPPPPAASFGKRPSPIDEERGSASDSPPTPSAVPDTASTSRPAGVPHPKSETTTVLSADSDQTVQGCEAPKSVSVRTPSYPFPHVATPGHARAPRRTAEKDGHGPALEATRLHSRPGPSRDGSWSPFLSDRVLSTPSTPASAATFLPSDAFGGGRPGGHANNGPARSSQSYGSPHPSRHDFASPDLYSLVLSLSTEPGLDAWWNAVVQIATEWYKADRVALAIPADSTDVENIPWGQKATFNTHEEDDDFSLGYMGRDSLGACMTDPGSEATPLLSMSGVFSPLPLQLSTPPIVAAESALRRPGLASRYSYTTYEDQKVQKSPKARRGDNKQNEAQHPRAAKQPLADPPRPPMPRRQTSQPIPTRRSDIPKADAPKGMLPPKSYASLNSAALEEHDAVDGPERPLNATAASRQPDHDARGRVLPVLQALDYEANPLIDHNGVQRVLDRGRVVALTRSYPYVPRDQADESEIEASPSNTSTTTKSARSRSQSSQHERPPKPSAPLGSASNPHGKAPTTARPSASFMRKLNGISFAAKLEEVLPPRPKSPQYEEYEQMPPSPWSQSPVPSPAVRHDATENPFFSDATALDEESFNPAPMPDSYKETQAPEAIGVDNAWTVLHVPLYHPLLSKTNQPFRPDKAEAGRAAARKHGSDKSSDESLDASPSRQKQMPIAILSILSPIIPYPSNLRYSLEHLAPHLATTLSLSTHYSNLEAEVNGLNRRRPELSGFGGVDTDGRPLPTPSGFDTTPYLPTEDPISNRSQAGSATSFSDYSAMSRSIAGSPSGTPGWDSALNAFLERRTNASSGMSPTVAFLAGDGYFGMRSGAFVRPATTPGGTSINGVAAGGAGGGSGPLRGRKNSASLVEKRASTLRLPEATLPAPDGHAGSPLPVPLVEAANATAPLPPPLPAGPAVNTQREPDATQSEQSADALAEAASSLGSTRTGHPAPTALDDLLNMANAMPSPQTMYDLKKPAAGKSWDTGASEGAGLAASGECASSANPAPQTASYLRQPRAQHRRTHSHSSHSQLHSYGADFASTFPSLPPSGTVAIKGAGSVMLPPSSAPSRAASVTSASPVDMPPPSDRLKSLILDSLPAHVFVAMPQTGAIVWVNSRFLAYRGQTVEGLADDPWESLHPDDREEYLKAWSHSVRTGDQFSRTVRIRRFDGSYRWFQARAVASRDRRNSIVQFLGSYMDIHDQHIAELKAARQEEIEASETKHRILANLIPQIIFTANEEEGVTFANEQWRSYTGQDFQDLLGLGFLDSVHPDDLAKCSFIPVPAHLEERRKRMLQSVSPSRPPSDLDNMGHPSSRQSGGGRQAEEEHDGGLSELAELARRGIILVTTDDNGRPSYTTEVRLRSKTGEYRWHLVRCVETGTMDFGKGYNSYFGSATDINDHKKLEAKLKEAMDSKTRFLSNMSHEIRTPLIGISGMVSFLQDTTLNEEQRDYTNTIQTSANSLLMIINDILDLSKVDAGMMKLSFEWFHTRSLIEDVNELVSTMAIAKGLELNYIVDADVPSWVKGDRVRMRQVLLNVIGNAIKFTATGEVFSRCRVVEKKSSAAANKIELEFSVMDTGRGFTKEEADLIFKPFSQIDGSSTRQHGGSGLGLVISRQLVELHGGRMDGTAVPGEGSTFTFTAVFNLPTEDDHPDSQSTSSQGGANLSASNVTLSAMGFAPPLNFVDPAAVVAAAAASAAGVSVSTSLTRPPAPAPSAEANMGGRSPAAESSGSSAPSTLSAKSRSFSERSTSTTSSGGAASGISRFSEAARASGQDLSHLQFSVPRGDDRTLSLPKSPALLSPTGASSSSSSEATATTAAAPTSASTTKPEGMGRSTDKTGPTFSILIVCPQTHSREATTTHIETTLPKNRPHRITAVATMEAAQALINDGGAEPFTHVVINLPSPKEILALVDQLDQSARLEKVQVLILSDSVQRQAVNRLAAGTGSEAQLAAPRVAYVYKPVKPSRFAVIFDPQRESDISIDRNRSSAQRLVESQKQSYLDLEQRMGNKGYKVLLVEDNVVNQKVLTKYLCKVGVDVDMAADGEECTGMVFARPHDYYSLILCDLHMPRKDGYQACREIREWEAQQQQQQGGGGSKAIPIIALSANVMSDVHDKCVEAGFNKYITKPVDFIDLSRVLSEFF